MKVERALFRIVDANKNRVLEAARVVSEWVRFVLDDEELYSDLKVLRKNMGEILAIRTDHFRDVEGDVGAHLPERNALEPLGVLKRNFYRLKEGLRTLEEVFKALGEPSEPLKRIRFEVYEIEKKVWSRMGRFFLKESHVVNFYRVEDVDTALREADFHTVVVLLGGGWEKESFEILRLANRCFVALDDARGVSFLGLYGIWGNGKVDFPGCRGFEKDEQWTVWECGDSTFEIRIGKKVRENDAS